MSGFKSNWIKLLRFALIYGPRRALVKALGRLRIGCRVIALGRSGPGVGIVGCGQFAYSTIGYFVANKARVVSCYDIDASSAATFAQMYGATVVTELARDMLANSDINCVYIASNHASHTEYAIAALCAGKITYVEKPIAVSRLQLARLVATERAFPGRVFAGYNRPFSKAVRDLRDYVVDPHGPLTLSCFVSGHRLPSEHWYRRPEEGTRICGNVGHWLDLAVHILSWGSLPDRWLISLNWSDSAARDDDLAINLVSENKDLVSIILTARCEPFEGINETINLQWDKTIAKIDDFRRLEVWRGTERVCRRYWPKDVGHKRAILQPFHAEQRMWNEVVLSSLLMLRVAQMVRDGCERSEFSFTEELRALDIIDVNQVLDCEAV